jgi:hypothetical protein
VLRTRSAKLVLVVAMSIVFGGCQMVGPIAIDQGRDRYNRIIQSTSKEQTFENIIRVYHHEPTVFMDVTEVDATTTFSGTGSGGVSNIGARAGTSGGTLSGQTESLAGGVTYSESPLIRYQPLLGQALVAQLATPVSATSLDSLFVSSWTVMPLFDLSTSYLTLDFSEFYSALNPIGELAYDNAIALIATKSDLTKEQQDGTRDGSSNANGGRDGRTGKASSRVSGNGGVQVASQKITLEVSSKPTSSTGTDTLVVYLNPFHSNGAENRDRHRRDLQLWVRLLELYFGTQKDLPPKRDHCPNNAKRSYTEADLKSLDIALGRKALRLNVNAIRECLPNFIELRTMPVKVAVSAKEDLSSGAPLLRTFSGLGILKNATEAPFRRVAFITAEDYRRIRSYPWNIEADSFNFYTLAPDDAKASRDFPYALGASEKDVPMAKAAIDWLNQASNREKPFVYEPRDKDAYSYDYNRGNRALGLLRRYVLIICSDTAPINAYVSHFDRGHWYYIEADDTVSQKNFDLISLFMTMMAVAPSTAPLSPSISVGSGGGM